MRYGEKVCAGNSDPRTCRQENETCPVSTEGGTRRVQLVREGGRGGRGAEDLAAEGAQRAVDLHPDGRVLLGELGHNLRTKRAGGQGDLAAPA